MTETGRRKRKTRKRKSNGEIMPSKTDIRLYIRRISVLFILLIRKYKYVVFETIIKICVI